MQNAEVCAATVSVTIGHLDISSRVFFGHRVSFFWAPLVRHRGRGVALTPGGDSLVSGHTNTRSSSSGLDDDVLPRCALCRRV